MGGQQAEVKVVDLEGRQSGAELAAHMVGCGAGIAVGPHFASDPGVGAVDEPVGKDLGHRLADLGLVSSLR